MSLFNSFFLLVLQNTNSKVSQAKIERQEMKIRQFTISHTGLNEMVFISMHTGLGFFTEQALVGILAHFLVLLCAF